MEEDAVFVAVHAEAEHVIDAGDGFFQPVQVLHLLELLQSQLLYKDGLNGLWRHLLWWLLERWGSAWYEGVVIHSVLVKYLCVDL